MAKHEVDCISSTYWIWIRLEFLLFPKLCNGNGRRGLHWMQSINFINELQNFLCRSLVSVVGILLGVLCWYSLRYDENDKAMLICNCRVFAGKAWLKLRKPGKCIFKLPALAFPASFQWLSTEQIHWLSSKQEQQYYFKFQWLWK